jgi:ubiquinone/menaquinone biosynthesis C-methylase UbiE
MCYSDAALDVFSQIQSLKEELARLQTQAEEFSASTKESLAKLQLKPDMNVLDVGCGTGDVSFMIAPIVGPRGHVSGVDFNPYVINHCSETAQKLKVINASFSVADAMMLDFKSQSYDAAYSRFVLQHIKEPRKVLREMIRLTKEGGYVMVEDCDLFTWIVHPQNKSVSTLWHWYESIQVERGTDPQIGRKLYSMFLEEGLEPNVDIYSKCVYSSRSTFWSSITAVLRKINSPELKSLIKGIEEFAMAPDSIFVFPLVFRVWSRIS